MIPSLRFEYFLSLLKNSEFIVGNSSAGIREAPYYNVPVVNIGSRQNNRSKNGEIINIDYNKEEILKAIHLPIRVMSLMLIEFGKGNSAGLFLKTLKVKKLGD